MAKPYPKHIRIKDPKMAALVRQRDGQCLYGLKFGLGDCGGILHAHHIKCRGAGGDDVKENMISLCAKHHDQAHWGKISKVVLYALLTLFYGYPNLN